jgi:hypothetical protein
MKWMSVLAPNKCRYLACSFKSASAHEENAVELLSLRFVDGHDLDPVGVVQSASQLVLSDRRFECLARAKVLALAFP